MFTTIEKVIFLQNVDVLFRLDLHPPVELTIVEQDVSYYASLGIRSATSFGCRVDEDYVKQHGDPPIAEYASILSSTCPNA